jgi:diaminopropionate ammonia-lyase
MTVKEEDALLAMDMLARPIGGDQAIVAGASGGAGLAGLVHVSKDLKTQAMTSLDSNARVLVINTESTIAPQRQKTNYYTKF